MLRILLACLLAATALAGCISIDPIASAQAAAVAYEDDAGLGGDINSFTMTMTVVSEEDPQVRMVVVNDAELLDPDAFRMEVGMAEFVIDGETQEDATDFSLVLSCTPETFRVEMVGVGDDVDESVPNMMDTCLGEADEDAAWAQMQALADAMGPQFAQLIQQMMEVEEMAELTLVDAVQDGSVVYATYLVEVEGEEMTLEAVVKDDLIQSITSEVSEAGIQMSFVLDYGYGPRADAS